MQNHFFLALFLLFAACTNTSEQKPVSSNTEKSLPEEQPIQADQKMPDTQEKSAPEKASTPVTSAPKNTDKSAPKSTATAPIMPEKSMTVGAEPASVAPMPAVIRATSRPLNHLMFDSLLQKNVSSTGKVNYKGLKAAQATLDAYCQRLSENPVQDSWSRAEKLAYWINTYNAYTLKLIVDNYPTKSILNFDGGKTWDVRRIRIGDKKYSLNNIENDIIRPTFKDPRIHFAINCAAQSCPPLWNHAYTAENLESTLESRARAFVNNSNYNTISSSRAQVSKIFDWYGVDFGSLRDFLNKYADSQLSSSAAIKFNEYNWDLNE